MLHLSNNKKNQCYHTAPPSSHPTHFGVSALRTLLAMSAALVTVVAMGGCSIMNQKPGSVVVESRDFPTPQYNRTPYIKPGEITIYDPKRPHTATYPVKPSTTAAANARAKKRPAKSTNMSKAAVDKSSSKELGVNQNASRVLKEQK